MDELCDCFALLELQPDAPLKEIQKSYDHLRNLYSCDSIEILALHNDFSPEMKDEHLSRLDIAYEKLTLLLKSKKPAPSQQNIEIDDETQRWLGQIECFDGAALRSVRERLGIDLKDMFAVTRIQPERLQEIEDEVFDFFRAEVYLRSFIIEYARFLSLDSRKVLEDYMPRYQSWAANREGRGLNDVPDMMTMLG